jgi:hypothetical protein
MTIEIPDQIISGMLRGVFSVVYVTAAGALLYVLLRKLTRKFPFTRLGTVIALAPLTLFNLLVIPDNTALLVFAMLSSLIGISIDGVNQLLIPKELSRFANNPAEEGNETVEFNPRVIAWVKVAKLGLLLLFAFLILSTGLSVSKSWISPETVQVTKEIVQLTEASEKAVAEENEKEPLENIDRAEDPVFIEDIQSDSNSDDLIRIFAAVEETQVIIAELSGRVIALHEDFSEYRSEKSPGENSTCAPVSTLMPTNSCSLSHLCNPSERKAHMLLPQDLTGTICLDTEFPLESYLRLIESTLDAEERKEAEQAFLQEIKKTPKTFWILTDNAQLIGESRMGRAFEILEGMEYEVYRAEAEELKNFIKQMGKRNP